MRGRIIATTHCVERLRERFPSEFNHLGREDVWNTVVKEVRDAIREGRMAKRVPRWAVRPGSSVRGRIGGEARRRYIWTEDCRRVYVVRRFDRGSSKHNPQIIAITAFAAGELDRQTVSREARVAA